MKNVLVGLILSGLMCAPILAYAQNNNKSTVVEEVTAPGGKTLYYILALPGKDSMDNPNMEIGISLDQNKTFNVLLSSHPSDDPENNLTGFKKLTLSPDSKTLYFQADAWAVSDAVHALNLTTKKVSYVTDGEIACVILGGEYQGHLVVEQHRYFVQGGSYDNLWLYDPKGKEIGLVSENTDASQACASLSPKVTIE